MIYARPERGLTRAIGYEVRGEGPAVLFLHPFPFDRSIWAGARAALDGFRTIALDSRGFGESELGEPGFSVDDLGDDAIALLDHLGVLSAAVVGCSMGGYVALSMAARHPARLSALLLCDTRADADGETALANRQAAIDEIRAHGPEAYLDGVAVRLCGRSAGAEVRAEVQRAALASSADFRRALPITLEALRSRPDRMAVLERLRLAALVVVGDEDSVAPPEHARQMQRALAGSKLATIASAGHLPMIERPEAFAATLRDFLAGELLTS